LGPLRIRDPLGEQFNFPRILAVAFTVVYSLRLGLLPSCSLLTMRRGLLIFVVVNLLVLSFLVRSVSTLLSLLVEDAAADAIHRAELPSPNSSLIEQRPQIIPKIIHQTYKNETIPEVWRDAQQSCIDLHPDYEYIVCTFSLLMMKLAGVFIN